MTARIPLSTLFIIYVIRALMNIARAHGSKNRILLERACEEIHREEMRNESNWKLRYGRQLSALHKVG